MLETLLHKGYDYIACRDAYADLGRVDRAKTILWLGSGFVAYLEKADDEAEVRFRNYWLLDIARDAAGCGRGEVHESDSDIDYYGPGRRLEASRDSNLLPDTGLVIKGDADWIVTSPSPTGSWTNYLVFQIECWANEGPELSDLWGRS